ncbi:KRF4 protein, partial [Alectura lathami]|nr:KRF4 protein [Alectura lathami]
EPSHMIVALPGLILSSYLQNTIVGSSTSAIIGSILSCDGVPITSGCCDLHFISSHSYGRRCPP